ncbi:MAG: response regulator [Chloroflexi bacterium]|nr:response regulator [Chloroflexota bacterium]MBU1750200.1 response regulator [Chloroflexota bacterium]
MHAQRPRLVLLDLLLPDVSGSQVLHAIREHPDPRIAQIPVIVVSIMHDDTQNELRPLISAYLSKPVDSDIAGYCGTGPAQQSQPNSGHRGRT